MTDFPDTSFSVPSNVAFDKPFWIAPRSRDTPFLPRMNFHPFLPLACAFLLGCKTQPTTSSESTGSTPASHSPPAMGESWEASELRLKREREAYRQYAADYASAHAQWRCERSDLPTVTTFEITDNTSKVALTRGLHLELRLGQWLDPDNDHRDFRSETRYVLRSGSGVKLGEAEGKLSHWGNHSPTGSLSIRFAPDTQCVQIDEEFSGVGDKFRQIVFQPEAGSPLGSNGVPNRWRTLHLEVPLRRYPIGENDEPGRIHGASNGKIYVEVDGQFYAFPVEEFVVTDLRFQAG